MVALYKTRFLQLFRLLKDIGLARVIALMFFLWFGFFLAYKYMGSPENTSKAVTAFGVALLAVHAVRKDKHFLKMFFTMPYLVYLAEYFALFLPFILIWIIYFNWLGIGLLLMICITVPLVTINRGMQNTGIIFKFLINPFTTNFNSSFTVRLPFIPTRSFEWISGIRRNLLVLLPVYLIFIAFSFQPYIGVIGFIILSLLVSGFYFYGESREFIEQFAKTPSSFLWLKIRDNLKLLYLFLLPILIISMIFQFHTWYYLAGAILASSLFQIITIIFKYGLFEENAPLNKINILVMINFLFIVLPFFWPVPIIMGIKYYMKARENLQKYFDD